VTAALPLSLSLAAADPNAWLLALALMFLTTGQGDAEKRFATGWFEDARMATRHRELDRIRRANPCPRR
jgi:hypothetical protein